MPLSAREQQSLDQIGRVLISDDPRLARTMRRGGVSGSIVVPALLALVMVAGVLALSLTSTGDVKPSPTVAHVSGRY